MKKEYVFDSVHIVARYLYSLKENISPIKLQVSLYFLYAYYGAIIQQQKEQGLKEDYPDRLFEATFEAWKYGSHIKEVYKAYQEKEYKNEKQKNEAIEEVKKNKYIQTIIDELFHQIDAFNDFTLLDRNHMDRSWKEAYLSESKIMKDETIIEEYVQRYL